MHNISQKAAGRYTSMKWTKWIKKKNWELKKEEKKIQQMNASAQERNVWDTQDDSEGKAKDNSCSKL